MRTGVLAIIVGLVSMTPALRADQGGGGVAHGEKVFAAQKCGICHAVAGKGNKAGSLDDVGTKLTADEIRAWLTTPTEMAKKLTVTRKPPMKSYAALPKEDIDGLVAYLQTLKKK
jgi:mono/diheme cytochrome c family protein